MREPQNQSTVAQVEATLPAAMTSTRPSSDLSGGIYTGADTNIENMENLGNTGPANFVNEPKMGAEGRRTRGAEKNIREWAGEKERCEGREGGARKRFPE